MKCKLKKDILKLIIVALALFGFLASGQSQNNTEKIPDEKLDVLNNVSPRQKKSKPYVAFNVKTQFPIQHSLGFEFVSKSGLSFGLSVGQLSRAYTVAATNFLPAEDENQEIRKQFIEDKMKNGLVVEFGTFFYPRNFRNLYFGAHLQLQRFTLPATTQELIENYGFADQIDQEVLNENLENELVQSFFQTTVIEPIIKPVQLGLTFGKKFSFRKTPNLSLMVELNYHINVASKTSFDSPSFIGNVIVNSFVEPNLDPSTADSFGSFNLPSMTLRLQYRIDASNQ